jgi:two-component system, LytTR family, response regulator
MAASHRQEAVTYAAEFPTGATTLRVVIADADRCARQALRERLAHMSEVAVLADCGQGSEAHALLQRHGAELLFVATELNDMDGLNLVRELPPAAPAVVITSSDCDRAAAAFEVRALDYLVTPVAEFRLAQALARVRETLEASRARARAVAGLSAAPARESPAGRLAVRVGDRIRVMRVADIDWIGADGDYVTLHAAGGTWPLRAAIAAIETRLAGQGFARIHRSTLVNVDRVREVRPLPTGDHLVSLDDGTELKLSRSYRAQLPVLTGADG